MFGGANQKAIDEEVARKKKEHEDNLELVQLSTLYEMQKVNLRVIWSFSLKDVSL